MQGFRWRLRKWKFQKKFGGGLIKGQIIRQRVELKKLWGKVLVSARKTAACFLLLFLHALWKVIFRPTSSQPFHSWVGKNSWMMEVSFWVHLIIFTLIKYGLQNSALIHSASYKISSTCLWLVQQFLLCYEILVACFSVPCLEKYTINIILLILLFCFRWY